MCDTGVCVCVPMCVPVCAHMPLCVQTWRAIYTFYAMQEYMNHMGIYLKY